MMETKTVTYLVEVEIVKHHCPPSGSEFIALQWKTTGRAWQAAETMPDGVKAGIPDALKSYDLDTEGDEIFTLPVTVTRPISRQAKWKRSKKEKGN